MSSETTNAKDAGYAFIFKLAREFADQIQPVIEKSVPEIPSSSDFDVCRKFLYEMLDLKRAYKEFELTEDCGEKAMEYFDLQNSFFVHYMMSNSTTVGFPEVRQILNEHGMQKVRDYIKVQLKYANEKYGSIDEKGTEKYIMEHCNLEKSD